MDVWGTILHPFSPSNYSLACEWTSRVHPITPNYFSHASKVFSAILGTHFSADEAEVFISKVRMLDKGSMQSRKQLSLELKEVLDNLTGRVRAHFVLLPNADSVSFVVENNSSACFCKSCNKSVAVSSLGKLCHVHMQNYTKSGLWFADILIAKCDSCSKTYYPQGTLNTVTKEWVPSSDCLDQPVFLSSSRTAIETSKLYLLESECLWKITTNLGEEMVSHHFEDVLVESFGCRGVRSNLHTSGKSGQLIGRRTIDW